MITASTARRCLQVCMGIEASRKRRDACTPDGIEAIEEVVSPAPFKSTKTSHES